MNVKRRIAKLLKIFLFLVITLVIFQGALVFIGFSFTSDKARAVLLEQIKILTQREANIDGEVKVTVSLLPELLVKRIRIKNAEGFGEDDFIALSETRIQLSLLSLLNGNIEVTEFVANRAHIGLIMTKDGRYNWTFEHLIAPPGQKIDAGEKVARGTKVKRRISVDRLLLTDITIRYVDEADNRIINKHFANLLVDLEDTAEPQAEITGTFQDYPYTLTFKSDTLQKLSLMESWNVAGSGMIAGRQTNIRLAVQLFDQDIEGSLSINVEEVDMGHLLEHTGIIVGEDAFASELDINVLFKGADVTEMISNAKIESRLHRGYWRRRAQFKEEIRELAFNEVNLYTSWNKPVHIQLDGQLLDEVIKIDFITNRFSEFFDDLRKFKVDLTAHFAGSDFKLNGSLDLPLKKKHFDLDISVKGDDLEELSRLLNIDLPPLQNHNLTGRVTANKKGFIVKADDASIGDTHFRAVIVIDNSSLKPYWTINLDSRQLQIRDFEFADRELELVNAGANSGARKKTGTDAKEELGWRLKKVVTDPKTHFDLNLNVEKLLAGETALGASRLSLKLRDNTLILENAEFDVPGGKIKSSAAFKTESAQVKGALKLDIDKFDYGAVARYFNLGAEEGGVISARIDLKMGGRDFSRLFDHATGKLDVALWPINTQTQLFDLWANSLLLLVLPEIRKKEDTLNCIVALMDLDDGIMKEDFFGMDTRKVWMHGNIEVDFRNEMLALALYPRSKKARIFAVQAPIRAQGSFGDIRLNTNPVDLTVAYLSFVTSPLHVPARRVLGDKVPEDASERCEQFFDRDYVKKLKEKIEQEEQKEIDEWLDSD